jgi:hypothetical protein
MTNNQTLSAEDLAKRLEFQGRFASETNAEAATRRITERTEAATLLRAQAERITEYERTIARMHRQRSTSRSMWLRAAEAALSALPGASSSSHPAHDLWVRVEMAKVQGVEIVQSAALATSRGEG